MTATEATRSFPCFGSTVTLYVGGASPDGRPAALSARIVQRRLASLHARLSRFDPSSELSRLNADARTTVPASRLLRRFARAAVEAGELSGGLVDATLIGRLEDAGYASSREAEPGLGVRALLRDAPERRAAGPSADAAWRSIAVDDATGTITRPPSVRVDGGGIAKGLAADLAAQFLAGHATYAVDCAGDIAVGGASGAPRLVRVDDPFGRGTLEERELVFGAVATSGIGRRSWVTGGGGVAHHLIDPATGRPAFTGVVQVTAFAPSTVEAEVRAKAALLSGPEHACDWLTHGGLMVLDDGSVEGVDAAASTMRAPA